MVLRLLWCWLKPEIQGYVRIVGDAQGVLFALIKRSAKSLLLNIVVRETPCFWPRIIWPLKLCIFGRSIMFGPMRSVGSKIRTSLQGALWSSNIGVP